MSACLTCPSYSLTYYLLTYSQSSHLSFSHVLLTFSHAQPISLHFITFPQAQFISEQLLVSSKRSTTTATGEEGSAQDGGGKRGKRAMKEVLGAGRRSRRSKAAGVAAQRARQKDTSSMRSKDDTTHPSICDPKYTHKKDTSSKRSNDDTISRSCMCKSYRVFMNHADGRGTCAHYMRNI